MKQIKYWLHSTVVVVIAAVMIITLTGCSVYQNIDGMFLDGSGDTPRKFGATYMTMNNPFFDVLNDSIKEVVEASGDILITRDPAQDQEKQNDQIMEMIELGVEAIFLNPADWKEVKPALEACHEAGIPIFNVDTYVYDTEYIVTCILSDNYKAGELIAEDMMRKRSEADIVILNSPYQNSIIDRVQGFLDKIEEEGSGNYRVVAQESAGGELERAMAVMEDLISQGVTCDVVLGGE